MVNVRVFPTTQELAIAAADHFYATAQNAIEQTGRFTVALTGGSTPEEIYKLMATPDYARRIDWSRVFVFWGDERAVGPDDPQSNYGMAQRTLLAHVPVLKDNVHRMRGEIEPRAAAAEYERIVHDVVGNEFDLIILGMGSNTHIASMFPGSALLHENRRMVAAEYVAEVKMWRITFTPPLINNAKQVVFWVAGDDKRAAVHRVFSEPRTPDRIPAQVVQPKSGDVLWLLDEAAGASL